MELAEHGEATTALTMLIERRCRLCGEIRNSYCVRTALTSPAAAGAATTTAAAAIAATAAGVTATTTTVGTAAHAAAVTAA